MLMVDTGSNLNLIKVSAVNNQTSINRETIYHLTGIGSGMYSTLGKITVVIKGIDAHFHIVGADFPIKQQGILGMQFLWENKATLNFRNKELAFHGQYVPLSGHYTIHLPARTKKLINIPVIDPLIKNGYLRRIEAGPGVFLGESLLSQHDGFVKTGALHLHTRSKFPFRVFGPS